MKVFSLVMVLAWSATAMSCGKGAGQDDGTKVESSSDIDSTEHPSDSTEHPQAEHLSDSTTSGD